jgi:hypothetical protein
MTRIDELKAAVQQLPPEEMKAFRDWFEALQEDLWDQRIERDIEDGKLDKLAEKWRADYEAGRFSDLTPPQRPGKP